MGQQRQHLPFVRQLIDRTEFVCNRHDNQRGRKKYFLMLVHVPAQEIYNQSAFPAIFLHGWDFFFFDTCAPGSAFHLQRMLTIVSSPKEQSKEILCDLNVLFDDCLWDFCSRTQIFHRQLSREMFSDENTFQFYRQQISVPKRIECLKKILQQLPQLQEQIVHLYHQQLSAKKTNPSLTPYYRIYQMSKDILCGKRLIGLVDSLQMQIRTSFTNFVSNILKYLANDYGLQTLSKLSGNVCDLRALLKLIDYSSFVLDEDTHGKSPSPSQGIFQLVTHYPCILQTPLYQLFHQRIKGHAENIKRELIGNQNKLLNSNTYERYQTTECSKEQFSLKLTKSIEKDEILKETISETLVRCYSNDLVRIYCMTVEGQFDNDENQSTKTIDFISNWLLLKEENEFTMADPSSTNSVCCLAQVYTTFEYEQNEISLIYSACRILDSLKECDYEKSCQDENTTRSIVREKLFRTLFDLLWKKLTELCSNPTQEEIVQWIYMYTFIQKYYPSNTLLRTTKLAQIANRIEFMRLSYAILANETIPEPVRLVSRLLTHLPDNSIRSSLGNNKSAYLEILPTILNTIYEHEPMEKNTLMIDVQQWILSILKTSKQRSQDEINAVFTSLGDSKCQWSIPTKQLLFDELIDLTLLQSQGNALSLVDRIEQLLPIILRCIPDRNHLENYQIPHHPSVLQQDPSHRIVLLDLFFLHLDRHVTVENTINEQLIHELMAFTPPEITDEELVSTMKIVFKQLREYFLVRVTALYLCEAKFNEEEKYSDEFLDDFKDLITSYLSIDETTAELSNHLQIFLSTIVSKRSWAFLFNIFKSTRIENLDTRWTNILYGHLKLKQESKSNEYLQSVHQLQFTLSAINHAATIFPELHQSYDELNQIMLICVNNNETDMRWKHLCDWIQDKPNEQLTDIKVMLLLNIYYNYYCHNQLQLLNTLLDVIENTLEPKSEELRVFRCLLDPEHCMIGYSQGNNDEDLNYLNNLFRLDCQARDELCIRHLLVNLMAMILKGGPKSFLWTFAFQPLAIENTFGRSHKLLD